MAAPSIISSFFMLASPSSWNSRNKSKICSQRLNSSSNTNGKTVKLIQDSSLKIKSHAQAVLNDKNRVTSMIESQEDHEEIMTSPPSTTEHLILAGRLIKGGRVFQQNVFIRSFELDTDYKVSTKAIMNYLQEASLNHRKKMGMSADALCGITPEMSKRDLLWVFRSMRIEVDHYPSWYTTGLIHQEGPVCVLTGLSMTSRQAKLYLAVMMNKITRKTCKLPEEVKQELKPFRMTDAEPIVEAERNSPPEVEIMDHIRTGLTPGWNDLDFNYHVNNAKYLDWILESTPGSLIYSYELSKINVEYRKECLKDDVIQSLSRVVTNGADKNQGIELEHVLRLESGPQVLRAWTAWRPKPICLKPWGNNNI
ncbi:hypothetical protein CRYUN_Cryun34aG0083300 [Craigia yunnanensis]